MNQRRTAHAVVIVTVGYLIVLGVWMFWLRAKTPPGTLPYQLAALVAGFGAALGLAMMLAGRGTAEERRLAARGVEGWATVEDARPIDETSTELHLIFTIPGSASFAGRIVYSIPPAESARFATGSVVPVLVDPDDHHRVLLLPGQSFDE